MSESAFWLLIGIASGLGLVGLLIYMRKVGCAARSSFRKIDTGVHRMDREVRRMKTDLSGDNSHVRSLTTAQPVHHVQENGA